MQLRMCSSMSMEECAEPTQQHQAHLKPDLFFSHLLKMSPNLAVNERQEGEPPHLRRGTDGLHGKE